MGRFLRKWASVVHALIVAVTGMATAFGFKLTAEQVASVSTGVTLVIGAIIQADAANGNGK